MRKLHSEPVKLSTTVARASIDVRGKARGAKTREFGEPNDRSFRVAQRRRSRKAASAAGWRYFHRLSVHAFLFLDIKAQAAAYLAYHQVPAVRQPAKQ